MFWSNRIACAVHRGKIISAFYFLDDLINEFIYQRVLDEQSDRDYSYFHASEFSRCKRQIAYHYYESRKYISVANDTIKVKTTDKPKPKEVLEFEKKTSGKKNKLRDGKSGQNNGQTDHAI